MRINVDATHQPAKGHQTRQEQEEGQKVFYPPPSFPPSSSHTASLTPW